MASNGTSDGPRRRQGSQSQGIINLSPLGGKRTFHPTTSPPSCQDDDAINMGKKGSKKTENKTFPGNSTPWSTGPRTVSILTALNELSISDKVEKSSSTSSCRTDQLLGRITNGDATKQRKCLVPETKYFSTLRNDLTFSESTIRGESRLLPQIPREQGNYREGNERLKSESTQPPEWIQKIFQLTKFGRLDKLIQLLQGLDSTVIRHLVDSSTGQNLLHCAAGGGQLNTLQWLLDALGGLVDAALSDVDDSGRTPILRALKKKRLDCFKWMVLQTGAGEEALLPPDETQSLLHHAARNGNLTAVQWLVGVHKEREVGLDVINVSSRMTPLCEAAAAGKSLVCHELIRNGADPMYQTDYGWRPLEFALSRNQSQCANYLMMAETTASLGSALSCRLQELEALQETHNSLASSFRELLRVGKWLVKERTDLIKNSSSIGFKSETLLLGESGARFSDMEHKLGQAEQAGRLLLKNTGSSATTRMEAVIANSNPFNLLDVMAAVEKRCETMTILPEMDESLSSSSEEEDDDNVQLDKVLSNFGPWETKSKSYLNREKSRLAPWLLSNSQLSPEVRQLDLLETEVQSRPASVSRHNGQSPARDAGLFQASLDCSNCKVSSQTPAQVIEPNLVSIKGPPDLICEAVVGCDSVQSLNKKENWNRTSLENGIDTRISSDIGSWSSPSTTSCLKRDSTPPKFGPTSFTQSPIISNFSANKCQTHQSCCDTLSTSPHPSSSPQQMYLDPELEDNNRNSLSNLEGKKSSLSKSGGGNASLSLRPIVQSPLVQYPLYLSPSLKLGLESNNHKSGALIDSTPTFPVQVGAQTVSNTPAQENNGNWELGPLISLRNMDSPSPSETESALIPSNTSQGSKTESAREVDEHDSLDVDAEHEKSEEGRPPQDKDNDDGISPSSKRVDVERRFGIVSNKAYVTKNGRRQRKAWYEMEGSEEEEEEESFLRKTESMAPS